MRVRRAADFPSQVWERVRQAKADFLADRFEEECRKRGVNPEHPRLEGYVAMDGIVPRFVVQTKRIGGGLDDFRRFNRNEISEAVDFALECASRAVERDQCEEELVEVEGRFRESFEVRRLPGSADFSISPKTDSGSRMSAKIYWFRCGPVNKETGRMDATCANLKLEATLPLEDALALCEDALHSIR